MAKPANDDAAASGLITITITVAYSPAPQVTLEATVRVPAGSAIGSVIDSTIDALQVCDAQLDVQALKLLPFGVWGRTANAGQVLLDGDRLEFYRPLKVDPKIARRERFAKQGARSAGLFSKRRPGAKSGY